VAWWPFRIDDGRVDEHLRLARVLMNRHDTVGAEAALERAHAMRPGDTATEFNLGMAQLGNGQVEEGLLHVRHAVDAGVAIPGARYALAGALLTTGDRDGAVRLLESFHPAPEDDAESCRRVAQLAMAAGVPQVAERYAQRASELGR
jgi:Flp pilus assembly protein TadD